MSGKGQLIGIDLGGTAIKAGRIDRDGENRKRLEVPAHVNEGPLAVCERIANLTRELGGASTIGIGVPGLIDRNRGLVTHSPNLAPMEGFALCEELARELGLRPEDVRLENDANAAALGEHWLGAARDEENVLMVTLGTGIGGGLILNQRLFTGSGGLAAEVGHVNVDPNGPRCGCGNRGCLEALASATAASRRARDAGLSGDLQELCAEARAGEEKPAKLLVEIGRDLGRGLAQAVMLLDLDCFLIGGGFGAALDLLLPGIQEGLLERSYGRTRESLRVLPALLGADAGWIGAAKLGEGSTPR
ncbi:MAG: glucokinase [Planctomycetota bacterium]